MYRECVGVYRECDIGVYRFCLGDVQGACVCVQGVRRVYRERVGVYRIYVGGYRECVVYRELEEDCYGCGV